MTNKLAQLYVIDILFTNSPILVFKSIIFNLTGSLVLPVGLNLIGTF